VVAVPVAVEPTAAGLSSSSQILVECVSFRAKEPTTNVIEATMIG
jgi:hypothetical protein